MLADGIYMEEIYSCESRKVQTTVSLLSMPTKTAKDEKFKYVF
jgi:hypothetical protein